MAWRIKKEIWDDIPGFRGRYEVSSYGRVRSLPRKCKCRAGGYRTVPGGLRRIFVANSPRSYPSVHLGKRGKGKTHKIHILVATVFVVNPEPGKRTIVNHKDGDKTNARADNLEWTTQAENSKHAHETGLSHRGAETPNAMLDENDVRRIRRKLKNKETTLVELAKYYGVHLTTISAIKRRVSWKWVA
jgi:hypothetical protein